MHTDMAAPHNGFIFFIGCAAVLAAAAWIAVLNAPSHNPSFYFLDVGQGDAELAVFPGGQKILTDAGPNNAATEALGNVLPLTDPYIDIGVVSHAQSDHFGGFAGLLDRYTFGAFLWNGRDGDSLAWRDFKEKLRVKGIPLVRVGKGDTVTFGDGVVRILSPDERLARSGELNDTAIVELMESRGLRALFSSDIDSRVESAIGTSAEILKVAHHGSKYSSSESFLRAVHPALAIIEVGARNTYGHPAPQTTARLADLGIPFLRTDREGTIKVFLEHGHIRALRL